MLARGVRGAFIGLHIYTLRDGGASRLLGGGGHVGMLSQPAAGRGAGRSTKPWTMTAPPSSHRDRVRPTLSIQDSTCERSRPSGTLPFSSTRS